MKNASRAARSLARRGLLTLDDRAHGRPGRAMGRPGARAERAAAGGVRRRSARRSRRASSARSCCTASPAPGKTEVYLRAIDERLAQGRGALLLVPEIALTPAMAGQFFSRFGDRVAILHSAFTDAERAEQWRRIRSGAAPVVVGTRSGVFAPVREPGPDRRGRGARPQLQAGRDAALQRPRRGRRARPGGEGAGRAGLGHAQPGEPLQRRHAASTRCWSCRSASSSGPCRRWNWSTCARSFWRRASRRSSRAGCSRRSTRSSASASRRWCCSTGAGLALAFDDPEDAQSVDLQRMLRDQDAASVTSSVTGLEPGHPLFARVEAIVAARQAELA